MPFWHLQFNYEMFKTMCMISVCSCVINDVNLSSRPAPERPLPSHRGSQLSQSFPSSQSGLLVVNMQHRQYLIERYFVLDNIACLTNQRLITRDQPIITAAMLMMQ